MRHQAYTLHRLRLGPFDKEEGWIEPVGRKLVRPKSVTHVSGIDPVRDGRGERIRTSDLTVPNRTRYQTALRPDRE